MTDNEAEREPSQAEGSSPNIGIKNKAYSSVLRTIKEEELLNIGCLRLLVEDKERLEREKADLVPFQSNFYEKDKSNAVLSEKVKSMCRNEILYNVTISLGGLFLGLSKSLWDNWYFGIIMAIGGAILWIVGVITKVVRMEEK